jgi:UV DNA damage endonuclease
MIRLGLCCIFRSEPIRFRRVTAKHLLNKPRKEQLRLLADICRHNALALGQALYYCKDHGIGAFRVNSQILPLKTHPEVGYAMQDLPEGEEIMKIFRRSGAWCRRHDIRTTFHPDQFIVLNSPDPEALARSVADLVYHAEVAQWVRADVINLHAGGVYGDKKSALARLTDTIGRLPAAVRRRLTLENDDRSYTPSDLLPVCRATATPLVYDVHHHRCLPDGMSVGEATAAALTTWRREPLLHLSTPLNGWGSGDGRPHHDFIDPDDFPCEWRDLNITVEIEAKAKEEAVLKLAAELPDYLREKCKNTNTKTPLP